jgi:hypothetical protein
LLDSNLFFFMSIKLIGNVAAPSSAAAVGPQIYVA